MSQPLNIAVADDETDMRDYYREILPDMGHRVVVVAATGRELLDQCRGRQVDLVISDIRMPDMDGIQAADALTQQEQIPFILVSAYHDENLIRRAEEAHIMAYLVKPIQQADLVTAIAIVRRRFDQFQALRREAIDLKQALSDRKVIEQAKGMLMRLANLDEPTAFRRLQKLARDENRKLVEVARMIVTAQRAFEEDKES